jgi:hypothetical protein
LQEEFQTKAANMNSKYLRHVHPAISVVTLVLLTVALVGALTATGLLP